MILFQASYAEFIADAQVSASRGMLLWVSIYFGVAFALMTGGFFLHDV